MLFNENDDIKAIIEQSARLLGRGEAHDAKELLKPIIDSENPPAAAIALFARAIGQIESFEAGIRILENRIATFPKEHESMLAKTELLIEAGRYNEAASYLAEVRNAFPENLGFARLALDLAELAGNEVAADNLLESLLQKLPNDINLLERAEAVKKSASKHYALDAEIKEIQHQSCLPQPNIPMSQEFIEEFLRLFAGREGVHAVQVKDEKGRWGYRPVKSPLNSALVSKHISGDATLGVYLMRRNNSTNLMALDLDIAKQALKKFDSDPREQRRLKLKLVEEAKLLLAAASEINIHLLTEWSGYKGFHFWLFTAEPVAARILRSIGRWLLNRIPPAPPEFHWELFPKQDYVEPDGLGNLVKIPLGIHRRSMKRSLFLEPPIFRPYRDQAEAFLKHPRLTNGAIGEVLGRITISQNSLEVPVLIDEEPVKPSKNGETPSKAPLQEAEALENTSEESELSLKISIPLPKKFPEEIENMLAECRVLGSVVTSILGGDVLTDVERHVLVYLLAPLKDEGKICLHQLLSRQPGYDPGKVNKEIHAVSPNPMSCGRVRRLLPQVAANVGCKCKFRLPDGCYQSPVVLAGMVPQNDGSVLPSPSAPPALSKREEFIGASGGIDSMMREYVEIQETIKKCEARLKILRSCINSLFDKAGSDCIVTQIGEYRRLLEPLSNVLPPPDPTSEK